MQSVNMLTRFRGTCGPEGFYVDLRPRRELPTLDYAVETKNQKPYAVSNSKTLVRYSHSLAHAHGLAADLLQQLVESIVSEHPGTFQVLVKVLHGEP
jgi:hypothetical protein